MSEDTAQILQKKNDEISRLKDLLKNEAENKTSMARALRDELKKTEDLINTVPWIVLWISHDFKYKEVNAFYAGLHDAQPARFTDRVVGSCGEYKAIVATVARFARDVTKMTDSAEVQFGEDYSRRYFLLLMHRSRLRLDFSVIGIDITKSKAAEASLHRETARRARLELEREAIERQMELTAAVQSFFLPPQPRVDKGCLALAAHTHPADRCSGDWWWCDSSRSDRLAVALGDVTGHGIAPAFVTASVVTGLHYLSLLKCEMSLPQALDFLHNDMLDRCKGNYWMTVAGVEISEATGIAHYYTAGAPPLLVVRRDGSVVPSTCNGHPLGSSYGMSIGHEELLLQPGERALLFTDGLMEMTLPNNRILGMVAIVSILQQVQSYPLDEAMTIFIDKLAEVRQGILLEDDITFVLVERRSQ